MGAGLGAGLAKGSRMRKKKKGSSGRSYYEARSCTKDVYSFRAPASQSKSIPVSEDRSCSHALLDAFASRSTLIFSQPSCLDERMEMGYALAPRYRRAPYEEQGRWYEWGMGRILMQVV